MARYKQTLAAIQNKKSGRSSSVANSSSRSGGGFFSRLFSNSGNKEKDTSAPTPISKAPSVGEKDSGRLAATEFNAIPQPKVALAASQPAVSPVPEAALPTTLAALTPYTKPKDEAEAAPLATEQTLFASVLPRIKPEQIIEVAALPAATPSEPRRTPLMPQKVETPKDGIAAIIAATGEQTPDSLRPLINTQLAYASPNAGADLAQSKFNKKSALSAQAPFVEQRLPNLLPKPQPAPQTVAARAPVTEAALVGFHSAPQANAVLMLDPTWTANNRRTITMQHPDQNQLTALMASVTSILKDSLTKTPYQPVSKRIKRGSAIAWLDSIYTGEIKVSSR